MAEHGVDLYTLNDPAAPSIVEAWLAAPSGASLAQHQSLSVSQLIHNRSPDITLHWRRLAGVSWLAQPEAPLQIYTDDKLTSTSQQKLVTVAKLAA